MTVSTRFSGNIVELIVEGWDSIITEDVALLGSGRIPAELIQQLKAAADEFEEHNKSLSYER